MNSFTNNSAGGADDGYRPNNTRPIYRRQILQPGKSVSLTCPLHLQRTLSAGVTPEVRLLLLFDNLNGQPLSSRPALGAGRPVYSSQTRFAQDLTRIDRKILETTSIS
jgi:hypothetical protein